MGICMTYFMLAMQIGNGIGPVILGYISDQTNLDWAFYIAALCLAVSSVLFFFMVKNEDSRAAVPTRQ